MRIKEKIIDWVLAREQIKKRMKEKLEELTKKDRQDFDRILGHQLRQCEIKHPLTIPLCKKCKN